MMQPPAILNLKKDRSWLAAALVAFFMPFYLNWSVFAILLFFIILLSDTNSWKQFRDYKLNRLLYPMALLYIIYIAGLVYTTNREEGWFNLQTKLPLLLFPLFLPLLDYSKSNKIYLVMLSFAAGCLLAGAICIAIALYTWIASGINHFFYVDFSIFMHPSYFALYLNLILCYIYQQLIFEDGVKYFKMPVIVFTLFFVNALILLLSSKAGIFTAALVQVVALIASFIRKKHSKRAIIIFLGTALFYFLFYKVIIPANQERIMNSGQAVMNTPLSNTATESSSVRLLIWKSSLPLVKKTFLFGVGTGDVREELMKAYKSNGITSAIQYGLNAHNQFLQTLLAIGLPGLILLLLSLLLPFLKGLRSKNYLLYMFPVIVGFNFLFESMLERQAGTVFFAFFGTLLILFNSHRQKQSV